MSAVASARPSRRTVACVAPFKVVRRDATGAGEKRVVAHATQRDATCDARRSAVLKARARTALDLPAAKRNKVASSCRPAGRRLASDLHSSREGRRTRLTAGVAISWRTSSAPGTAGGCRCLGIFASGPPMARKSWIGALSLQPTERRQDKGGEVRPGQWAKEPSYISALTRCAALSRDVRIREGRAKSAGLAPCAGRQCPDRKAGRSRVHLGHSPGRHNGSHWPHRRVTRESGWSA
jgi:hypothetical protein